MPSDVPKVISYDIVCQWHPHLFERLEKLPDHVRIEVPEGELRFAIPKYHFRGHKQKDHSQYSFNFTPGSCRTDGEEVERFWWKNDAIASSTREMGPGSRQDAVEDNMGFINYQKKISLGTSLYRISGTLSKLTFIGKLLRKRLVAAVNEKEVYVQAYEDFKADVQPGNVESWVKLVTEWEANPRLPDPYEVAPSGSFIITGHRQYTNKVPRYLRKRGSSKARRGG